MKDVTTETKWKYLNTKRVTEVEVAVKTLTSELVENYILNYHMNSNQKNNTIKVHE